MAVVLLLVLVLILVLVMFVFVFVFVTTYGPVKGTTVSLEFESDSAAPPPATAVVSPFGKAHMDCVTVNS